jgi:NADH-quinone oxidoreductase subunit L
MDIQFAWLCLIFPLIGVILTPFLSRISTPVMNYGAVFFAFLTAVSAVMMLPLLFSAEKLPLESTFVWLHTPISVSFGVLLDPLSVIVANVVAVISFFIMVYCLGYMKGDPCIMRFWMLMNAFIGSMLLLVLANNLIIIFIGWKLVGLCSYGLIGFYYRDEKKYWIGGPAPFAFDKPSACGVKAFIVTSVGDMLMLGGILIVYYYSGTFNILELYQTAPVWIPVMAETNGMIILVSILLIAGPMGKSAQFPFQEWLPEAMSGPGPVSALIHAATMVKSGVFLIARFIPIFYYGYWTAGVDDAMYFFLIVAWVGAITAFLAASQGLVATELKKILAYSTVSQIGYMMLALGVSGFGQDILVKGYMAGTFHLMSHAMFKACLFLCAGTVIHAAHSIYITDMGGMRKYMPYTWIFMGLATLSLIGIPPLPGFWSKEAVLVATLESHHFMLFAIALVSVIFTAFYSTRYFAMIFHGKPSRHIRKETSKPGHHVGEGYKPQTFACGALAVGIITFGLLGIKAEHALYDLFKVQLVTDLGLATIDHVYSYPKIMVVFMSVGSVLIGAIPAYFFYISGRWDAEAVYRSSRLIRMVHAFLWNRWYINSLYNFVFVRGVMGSARIVADKIEEAVDGLIQRKLPSWILKISKGTVWFDQRAIDGVVDGTAYNVVNSGQLLSRVQTGKIQEYLALAVIIALTIFGIIWLS